MRTTKSLNFHNILLAGAPGIFRCALEGDMCGGTVLEEGVFQEIMHRILIQLITLKVLAQFVSLHHERGLLRRMADFYGR